MQLHCLLIEQIVTLLLQWSNQDYLLAIIKLLNQKNNVPVSYIIFITNHTTFRQYKNRFFNYRRTKAILKNDFENDMHKNVEVITVTVNSIWRW